MSPIVQDGLKGLLEVNIYKDNYEQLHSVHYLVDENEPLAWLRHRLNLDLDQDHITEAKFTEYSMRAWFTDCWNLKNGLQKIKQKYSKEYFIQSNVGVSFVAYFPVADFNSLLETYEKEVRQRKAMLRKDRFRNFLYNMKSRVTRLVTRLEDVTISLDATGVSFPTPADSLRVTVKELKYFEEMKESLYRRMKRAVEEWGEPYMIKQTGFGIADSPSGDNNSVELILLGRKETTATLMDRLKENPDFGLRMFTDMFRPGSPGVYYKASIYRKADPAYSKFTNGEYDPFQRVKETRIFDYREKRFI